MLFSELELHEKIHQGIADAGFLTLTPVQAQAIPLALEGKDVAAQAQTGTGKTAAFVLPMLQRLIHSVPGKKGKGPHALVLAPTRELAVQIEKDLRILGGHVGLKYLAVYGGEGYHLQMEALKAGDADIIVATPGRLIDYLKQHIFNLKQIEVMVVDEADRMFDLGFIKDIRFILRRLPPLEERQTLLFSATLSARVMELAYEFTALPTKIMIEPEQVAAERVEQRLYHVTRDEKLALLFGIMRRENPKRVVLFANTKHETERLAGCLEANGYPSGLLSGDVPQKKRLKILDQFKRGEITHLVATDVASRGLHIDDVDMVINYDLPQDCEDYVHRIGRTARAGQSGTAISLADEELVHHLPEIEEFIGTKIPSEIPGDEDFVTDFVKPPRRPPRREKAPPPKRRERPQPSNRKPKVSGERKKEEPKPEGSAEPKGEGAKRRRRRPRKKPSGETPKSEG